MPGASEITQLLVDLRGGKTDAEEMLLNAVYRDLRQIAGKLLRRERLGHTLQPTALVHEAYLAVLGETDIEWNDRKHFFAAAAQAMRRILVDYARARRAAKREGDRHREELSENIGISDSRLEEALAIDEALTRLAQWAPRQSRIVELRFFGGLTESETADVLGIARRTVTREWNGARAWLHAELGGTNAL